MNKSKLFTAAEKTAQWMINNQITNREDANRGRVFKYYDFKTEFSGLTHNWMTGALCMSLLAIYKRTKDKKYLRHAEYAGRYIISLQVMDQRDEKYYGVIREITPQSIEFAPRDATTAAWVLVWLYEATKNPLYLDRAILFGNWHLKFAMHDGWPLYAKYMDPDLEDFYAKGSFQSGTGLFYHDLFMMSGDTRYIEFGLKPIADNYIKDFFEENGQLILERDLFTNKKKSVPSEQKDVIKNKMHLFNDDFGGAMLQSASDLFKEEKYRHQAKKYAYWLADNQNEDGSFLDGTVYSGVPVSLMYFNDLGEYYKDDKLLKARDKALKQLLSMQISGTNNTKLKGAFQGDYAGPDKTGGKINMNTRSTSYALMALLKLESKTKNIWLGRYNTKWIDPLKRGIHNLVW